MVKKSALLKETLLRLDGKGYKAYKEIRDSYAFPGFWLSVDHVQGDPFALPSRVRVRVERSASGFGSHTTANPSRRIALCDFLVRAFHASCRAIVHGHRGTGKSGLITIDNPVQEVLDATAMVVDNSFVEARFFMGLPARGRRISGIQAVDMFFRELPGIVAQSLYAKNQNPNALARHLETVEDADALRNMLNQMGLVGFVANGARLPRTSGIDPSPLASSRTVPFQSPDSLAVDVNLPNRGLIRGMGIPKGVTLIVGGGFHGKSTLLNALEMGIYNHLPGDGREMAVTHENTVKIRAADGRQVTGVDISPFINNLPLQKDTVAFSTQNASGSTSQAANIAEAIEAGARVLLLDEDTSATNFMIRDQRMQMLVAKTKEPITPFVDKVRQLYDELGISTVLVMGGSGDYFPMADHVIQMTDYCPADVTRRAHAIAAAVSHQRTAEGGRHFGRIRRRIPLKSGFNPYRGGQRIRIVAPRRLEILFGRTIIDLADLEQIATTSQTRGLAHALHHAMQYMDGRRTLKRVVDCVLRDVAAKGLECLTPYLTGDIAVFRAFELAAAINRMRTLDVLTANQENGYPVALGREKRT
jgi:predicted ABC-class ATPase